MSSSSAASSVSASSIVAKAETGSHVLKIDGYSNTKGLGSGRCITSRPFTIGSHRWCLQYYPDCYNSSAYGDEWISIVLCLLDYGKGANARYKISLLDQDGKPAHVQESSTYRNFSKRSASSASSWGSYEFIKRADLEGSSYLKDDAFSIRCDITVLTENVSDDVVAPAAERGIKNEAHGV